MTKQVLRATPTHKLGQCLGIQLVDMIDGRLCAQVAHQIAPFRLARLLPAFRRLLGAGRQAGRHRALLAVDAFEQRHPDH
jgi:hypothetical protein